jgi:hypothetical protein
MWGRLFNLRPISNRPVVKRAHRQKVYTPDSCYKKIAWPSIAIRPNSIPERASRFDALTEPRVTPGAGVLKPICSGEAGSTTEVR